MNWLWASPDLGGYGNLCLVSVGSVRQSSQRGELGLWGLGAELSHCRAAELTVAGVKWGLMERNFF